MVSVKATAISAYCSPRGPDAATAAGLYESPLHGKFQKIQILTIAVRQIDPSVLEKAKPEKSEKQADLDL